MGKFQLITKGLIKENPTFVLLLGMCPTLATTTSAINGMSMGLATLFVLVLSNMAISLIAPVKICPLRGQMLTSSLTERTSGEVQSSLI